MPQVLPGAPSKPSPRCGQYGRSRDFATSCAPSAVKTIRFSVPAWNGRDAVRRVAFQRARDTLTTHERALEVMTVRPKAMPLERDSEPMNSNARAVVSHIVWNFHRNRRESRGRHTARRRARSCRSAHAVGSKARRARACTHPEGTANPAWRRRSGRRRFPPTNFFFIAEDLR